MSTVEFFPSEPVTSVTHLDNGDGESISDPIVIGHYGQHGASEVWIDQGGKRVQIPAEHFKTIIKQLQRAKKLADAAEEDAA